MAESVQITRMHSKYEAILDYLIMHPEMPKEEIAAEVGVSRSWLSVVINSDLFQMRLMERREEVRVAILGSVKDKMKGIADLSLDRLLEKLENTEDPRVLLAAAESMLDRTGQGRTGTSPGTDPGSDGNESKHLHLHVEDLNAARELFGQMKEVHNVDTGRIPEARVSAPGDDNEGGALLEAQVHPEEEG